jgi:DNA-directed RNA polymerase subunit RPC12/RpoP
MKKSLILLLLIIIAGIFITGCVMDSISYCPYCGSRNIEETEPNVYKCNNDRCGKTFGAKPIKDPK